MDYVIRYNQRTAHWMATQIFDDPDMGHLVNSILRKMRLRQTNHIIHVLSSIVPTNENLSYIGIFLDID
jgi:hypothetical protein